MLKFIEKYGSISGGLILTLIVYSLDLSPAKIDIFADKSFTAALFLFGLCLTIFAIIHQGDNEKLRELKKYGSINRVNTFCFRLMIEALILCAYCLIVVTKDNDSITHFNAVFLCFIWFVLSIDAAIFLKIFYNIFYYKIEQ